MIFKKMFLFSMLGIYFLFGYQSINYISAEEGNLENNLPQSVSINLNIISGSDVLFDENILALSCDSDKNEETPENITPYCAILQTQLDTDWSWWGSSAFLNSINDIVGYTSKDREGNDIYHYWSWSLNGEMAMTALNQYELQENDSILLEFIDPILEEEILNEDDQEIDYEIQDDNKKSITSSGSIPSLDNYQSKVFDLEKAINFMLNNQKENGSFGEMIYTDWSSIGLAKVDGYNSQKQKIIDYLLADNFNPSLVTDYQRHAMALMSFNINPYNVKGLNYVEKIIDSFDGSQIGDKEMINDDIFGLIVLQKVGYTENDEIIKKLISHILEKQSDDGSWNNIDMTSVGIISLYGFKNIDDVKDAILKAFKYLTEKQRIDGGFENSFSTSWAVQAFLLDDSYTNNLNKSIEYLANNQDEDGGLDRSLNNDSRVWATAYAIPAVLELSWLNIMESFSKPEEVKNYANNSLMKEDNYNESVLGDYIEKNEEEIKKTEESFAKEDFLSENVSSSILESEIEPNTSKEEIKDSFLKENLIIIIISTIVVFVGGWFVSRR